MDIELRNFCQDDTDAVVHLFRETVRAINIKDYTLEQVNAWAPEHIDKEKWALKLLSHYTLVAHTDNLICGFADIDNTGYFDHLFVHKDYQGCGIAKKLTQGIEAYARQSGYKHITVAASVTAKPFFLKRGYNVIKPQQVTYNGQVFTNYFMEKFI